MLYQNKFNLYFLVTLWLLIHIFLFWYPGIRDQLFDAKVYIGLAESLHFEGAHHIFYSIPVLLIAFFKLFHEDGIIAFVIFQCVFSGFAALAIYKSAARLFNDTAAGFLSAIIFLCWWDIIQWNTVVMTESIFNSLICFLIYKLTHFKNSFRDHGIMTLLLTACVFTRPTGVVIILGGIVFLLTAQWAAIKPISKFLLLAVLLIIGYSGAVFMFSHWDFTEQYEKGNIITYMNTIEGQPKYDENLRMDIGNVKFRHDDKAPLEKIVYFIFDNPLYFLKGACLKVAYLLSGVRPYFSSLHNFYSVVWLSFIYILFYVGIRRPVSISVKSFALTVIAANCMLIAISTVDWDNRFYVPMQPAIVLFAGGGCAFILRSLRPKTSV